MSDNNARFHFALARISAIQLLRSTGVDRSRPSVIDSLADILVRYIQLLGQRSQEVAELAGRHACELEDVRAALESVDAIPVTRRENTREEEGVLRFITWCMSDDAANIRRVAGEGQDEMGQDVSADWLDQLIEKQIKITGEDKFNESILKPKSVTEINKENGKPKQLKRNREGLHAVEGLNVLSSGIYVPDEVKNHKT